MADEKDIGREAAISARRAAFRGAIEGLAWCFAWVAIAAMLIAFVTAVVKCTWVAI